MPESTTGLQDIIAHGYQTSPNYAEDFLRIDSGDYQVGSWNGNTAMAQAAIPAGDIGQWVTWPASTTARSGTSIATASWSVRRAPTRKALCRSASTELGHRRRGGGTERFFQGEIDDVEHLERRPSRRPASSPTWPRPLTATQSGLVADYPFDETSGDTAFDATGNGNNGTLGGISPNNPAAEPSRVAGIVLGPSATITPGESGPRRSPWGLRRAGGSGVGPPRSPRPRPHHGQCRWQRRGPAGHAPHPHLLVHRPARRWALDGDGHLRRRHRHPAPGGEWSVLHAQPHLRQRRHLPHHRDGNQPQRGQRLVQLHRDRQRLHGQRRQPAAGRWSRA